MEALLKKKNMGGSSSQERPAASNGVQEETKQADANILDEITVGLKD